MKAYERLLRYVTYDTASDESVPTCPSTESQRAFAEALAEELRELDAENVTVDSHGYLYAVLPANTARGGDFCIGFIAHLDTVADVPSSPVKPTIGYYTGNDVRLANGTVVPAAKIPSHLVGKQLMVTDGNTLLGADDKAGVAEIMTMVEYFKEHPEVRHGRIAIAFTPDEEIGRGADLFDIALFGADAAYTMDGGAFGEVEYETFNAASAEVTLCGINCHPGSAKNRMKNSLRLASEFDAQIPDFERPETTEGYEGFYHLNGQNGNVDKTTMRYILRDHDEEKLEERKRFLLEIAEKMNAAYGEGTVSVKLTDAYRNMAGPIRENWFLMEKAYDAVTAAGGVPVSRPIRGGTDGAELSFRGLPCPNLGTGGYFFHSRLEFACIEEMDAATDALIRLAASYVDFKKE
ncbi:MAG: peptidase T [Clostridia bacterium]|nr:peptidase T [Clostridia bacterium]